jgi:glucose-6-phosphate isomerase
MGWDSLLEHARSVADRSILDLFDASRAEDFSVSAEGLLLDYSKTNIDATTRDMLIALTEEAGLAERRKAMFTGEKINQTEGRAVLHTALRNLDGHPIRVDGIDVMPGVLDTLARMESFADGIRSGKIHPPGGGRFRDVVNIGIGGSDLGPAMAVQALSP